MYGPAVENPMMFQAFEWYIHSDGSHWRHLRDEIPNLKSMGIDAIWIPPACKAGSPRSNGYDVYDLYDLGEFEQKLGRATKWGSKEELVEMIQEASEKQIGIYFDAVLNHRAHGDFAEVCEAVSVDPRDRRIELGSPREIECWTGFNFPGRNDRYSSMKYSWRCFSGIDYDSRTGTTGIFKIKGSDKPGWALDVSKELGNYDYLMFADVDYSQPDVRTDVIRWGEWVGHELRLAGMRIDASKHFSLEFLHTFVQSVERTVGKGWFFVAEYWDGNVDVLSKLVRQFRGRLSFFDVPLVYNLSAASRNRTFDLRRIFQGTLCGRHPRNAVTFVQNHDTQETQALEAPIDPWFVPLAYALILLRQNNGYPCIFYGDLYGIRGPKARPPACDGNLWKILVVRKRFAYGQQRDYLDDPYCIGWTRTGMSSRSHGTGVAVVMTSSRSRAHKRMQVGRQHAGEKWKEIFGWPSSENAPRNDLGTLNEVQIDEKGWGMFSVRPRSVAIWVREGEPPLHSN